MLDFSLVRSKAKTITELTTGLKPADLHNLTNEMVNGILGLIAECTDEAVTFQPEDPNANDPYASDPDEVHMPWTLAHVIVHIAASAEESAALAAELARGVPNHGRSRYETPWQTVKTIAACRDRLEESRRMCLASLDMWPDAPHLDTLTESTPARPPMNALGRFAMGLMHEDSHLGQIFEIVRQAREVRKV
jgi:hypothetical protein